MLYIGSFPRVPRRALLSAALLVALLSFSLPARADAVLWEQIANPQPGKVDRLLQKARDLLADVPASPNPAAARPADNLAGAEALLRQAATLAPTEFGVVFALAELQAARGHDADAAATLERAEPLARLPSQRSTCWFRLGWERSKLGRYREAIASYDQQVALGDADTMAYSNLAELLMALGRLDEAVERYRDAIRIDERAGDRRGREQGLAFSYYGLGVALDRAQQEPASREAIARAVALDPNSSLLRLAQQPGSDVFFLPDGDVFYYMGLAAETAGNRDEAGVAFQEFVARQPRSPWVGRARVHIAALAPGRRPAGGGDAPGARRAPTSESPAWRVSAVATVLAQGPIPAPVIDAALKQRPPAWDACLAPYPAPRGHEPVRISVELEIDAGGAVTRASAKLPPPFTSGGAGRCFEDAVRARLVVPRPAHARPTVARVEVLMVGAGRVIGE